MNQRIKNWKPRELKPVVPQVRKQTPKAVEDFIAKVTQYISGYSDGTVVQDTVSDTKVTYKHTDVDVEPETLEIVKTDTGVRVYHEDLGPNGVAVCKGSVNKVALAVYATMTKKARREGR